MKFEIFALLQWPEILAILVVVLILFGAKKLPELARGLGQGIKEFKRATRDVQDDLQQAIEGIEKEPPSRPAAPQDQEIASQPKTEPVVSNSPDSPKD